MPLLDSLSGEQQREMVKYMKFFAEKREHTLSSVGGDFRDAVDDRLRSLEAPYAMEDILAALDQLETIVKDGVRQDLQRMVSMNVLLLKQLLEEASSRGIELSVNTATVENEYLIAEAERIRLEYSTSAEPKPSFQKSVLRSLKEEQNDLVHENASLSESNESLQNRFNALQRHLKTVLKDNQRLKDQLDKYSSSKQEDDRALSSAQDEIAKALQQAEAKVSSSKQFLQLKNILTDKNNTIAHLRNRLAQYEPQDRVSDDDA